MIFKDGQSQKKLKILRRSFNQVQSIANGYNRRTNKQTNVSISSENRTKRSVLSYLFGISASELESDMNAHFTELTKQVQTEFAFERQTVNSIIKLLNTENSALDNLQQTQNLILQKMHLVNIFHNAQMTGKYLLYITKMHAIITQMQKVYAYVLTLLIKSLHSTDHLYDCHNTNLLGLQHTCINLQDIDIENAEKYFNLHLHVAPLEYQNVFKISCSINQTNTSIINDLHLNIFSLKSLRL